MIPVEPPVKDPEAVRIVVEPKLGTLAKLMLSLFAGLAWAMKSVLGSEAVPPGFGVVTEMGSVPAVAMSEAGIEACN